MSRRKQPNFAARLSKKSKLQNRSKNGHFSASVREVRKNSPHRNHTKRPFSPHLQTRSEKAPNEQTLHEPHEWFLGRARNYERMFLRAKDRFWEMVEALRGTSRKKLAGGKRLALGRTALREIDCEMPNSNAFVSAFVEAARDGNFPRKRESQARFLGNSLGANSLGGNRPASARYSRDICGKEREKMKDARPESMCVAVAAWFSPLPK